MNVVPCAYIKVATPVSRNDNYDHISTKKTKSPMNRGHDYKQKYTRDKEKITKKEDEKRTSDSAAEHSEEAEKRKRIQIQG